MFEELVPYLEKLITNYHEVLLGQLKAEQWEEICAKALLMSGHGSDWTPDFNHRIGTDQITNQGIKISNKGGKINPNGSLTISGSRLTRFNSLEEKIEFIHNKDEDYILCLASEKPFIGVYQFIVINAAELDYRNAIWKEEIGLRGKNTGEVVGWSCVGEGYTAKISKSMSDQLWTDIQPNLFLSHHIIDIR